MTENKPNDNKELMVGMVSEVGTTLRRVVGNSRAL